MSPDGSHRMETEIYDFAEILAPQDGYEPPVVVGGHAVNLWSGYYLDAGVGELAAFPQDGRSDLKHVRMMILCVRAFISELVGFLPSGRISERVVVNLLEETLGIINGSPAEKAAKMWHFDFSNVWPWEKLRETGDGKVARWLEHRFPRHR